MHIYRPIWGIITLHPELEPHALQSNQSCWGSTCWTDLRALSEAAGLGVRYKIIFFNFAVAIEYNWTQHCTNCILTCIQPAWTSICVGKSPVNCAKYSIRKLKLVSLLTWNCSHKQLLSISIQLRDKIESCKTHRWFYYVCHTFPPLLRFTDFWRGQAHKGEYLKADWLTTEHMI